MKLDELLDARVLLVTGKGGVGKSSAAAALALAATRTGRRTCLVEVEGRQTMRALFGTEPWDFSEREFRPDLYGMSIDPEESLAEYLAMFYGGRRLSRMLVNSTAIEFATTAAPGVKDVLLIGKVKEIERRRDADGRFAYDLVVVDAPPTGRIINFLRAPEATTELVALGPIRSQAQSVIDMLLDTERMRVQLVTLLEEMPVTETVESAGMLRELGVGLNPVIVSRVVVERFDSDAEKALAGLDPETVSGLLDREGLTLGADASRRLLDLGRAHLERLALQASMREQLTTHVGLPMLELPYIAARDFGEAEVSTVADRILDAIT